jgi:hypothetical protein
MPKNTKNSKQQREMLVKTMFLLLKECIQKQEQNTASPPYKSKELTCTAYHEVNVLTMSQILLGEWLRW